VRQRQNKQLKLEHVSPHHGEEDQ